MEFEEYEYFHETEHFYDLYGSGYNESDFAELFNGTYYIDIHDHKPSDGVEEFRRVYGIIHGYLSVFVCILGIAANIVNIIVLSRKHMTSPTNSILTALGIADLISLFTYFMFITYVKFYPHGKFGYLQNESKAWIDYAIFWPHITFTFEIYGMWLTITLAVFQYLTVCHNRIGRKFCTQRNSNIAIFIVGGVSFLMCLPEYLLYESKPAHGNMSGWILFDSYIIQKSPMLRSFYLIFYGIVVKLFACALLIILSALLVRAIYGADKRLSSFVVKRRDSHEKKGSSHRKVSRRTTIMLIAVVMVFVSAEFPCGLLAFIGGCSAKFFDEVFLPMTEFFSLLTILNNAIKFILYCTMSQQFRTTFVRLMCRGRPEFLRLKSSDSDSIHTPTFSRTNIQPSEETKMIDVL